MKTKNTKSIFIAGVLLAAFALWTLATCLVDVRPIGPEGSSVGFAALNSYIHSLFGVHMTLYTITDWLGLVPAAFGIGFALLGLIQWIKRKHILKVDRSILVLGGFYIIVLAAYLLFEAYPVNYRPVLIMGHLEASYPSSTTLLALSIMPTSMLQVFIRVKNRKLRFCINLAISLFVLFMVIGRLLSGVHWFSDIVGAVLLSSGLVMGYYCLARTI